MRAENIKELTAYFKITVTKGRYSSGLAVMVYKVSNDLVLASTEVSYSTFRHNGKSWPEFENTQSTPDSAANLEEWVRKMVADIYGSDADINIQQTFPAREGRPNSE